MSKESLIYFLDYKFLLKLYVENMDVELYISFVYVYYDYQTATIFLCQTKIKNLMGLDVQIFQYH